MGYARRFTGKLRRALLGAGEDWSAERNIVITGPGRSGTTLTCHLLNKLPDTVAVNESITPGKYADRLPDTGAVADGIQDFYREQRRRLLKRGVVLSKHVSGVVPDNSKGIVDGARRKVVEKGMIPVDKDLSPDFFFAVKQTGLFTALLPDLIGRFACFAIVRNPLAIKASSLSLEQRAERLARERREAGGSVRQRLPNARFRYDATLNARMEKKRSEGTDPIDNWLFRIHSDFERYRESLLREHVIRYEDICESGGRVLSVVVPAAAGLDEPLENRNTNPLYKRDKVLRYGERLLTSEGAYWDFYTRESVEEIMDNLG